MYYQQDIKCQTLQYITSGQTTCNRLILSWHLILHDIIEDPWMSINYTLICFTQINDLIYCAILPVQCWWHDLNCEQMIICNVFQLLLKSLTSSIGNFQGIVYSMSGFFGFWYIVVSYNILPQIKDCVVICEGAILTQ